MKKFICSLAFFAIILTAQASDSETQTNEISKNKIEASAYYVDDAAVEATFEKATSVTMLSGFGAATTATGQFGPSATLSDGKSAIGAWVICLFVGGLGIHRWYLGTDNGVKVAYCLTLGGCGIISLGDCIVLFLGMIEDDIAEYVDNEHFIMW